MALPKIPKLKALQNTSGGTKTAVKGILIGALVILLGAFGLEASNTDFDMGKLLSGNSLQDSKVARDASGNVMRDKSGKVVTSGGKYTNEYNCDDFKTLEEAQTFFKNAGGTSKDTNRLDGDKDGNACESLPKSSK
jgi:hypothetical protein